MSFKIYTYGDPYHLNETSFWHDIENAPHLCVSQVMVNGFRDLFEKSFQSLLCPIDNVLKTLYSEWTGNIERRIAQYIAVSDQLAIWQQRENGNRPELYASLKHNQNSLLDALRLFVELGIDVSGLHHSRANLEQKVFIALLKEINKTGSPMSEAFAFKEDFSRSELSLAFKQTISTEFEREKKKLEQGKKSKKLEERVARLTELIDNFSEQDLNKVVIHGVHQFNPLHLRFITLLDSLGIEVIFLYNYQPEFKEIYSTWEQLYQIFGVNIERDTNLGSYTSQLRSKSHQTAVALAQLLEQSSGCDAEKRLRWNQVARDVEMLQFDNVTDFAGFISKYFDKSLTADRDDPNSAMTEKVYSAGREIHDLLRMYYPQQSGDRHFLNYPIGQFFMGLYRLWDTDTGHIKLDWGSLRECFTADVVKGSARLNTVLKFTRMYFSDVETYEGFVARVEDYERQYQTVQDMQNELGQQLRRIVFYRKTMIQPEDIKTLKVAVVQLDEIARSLFVQGDGKTLSFVKHFRQLERFIRERMMSLAEEEERHLVESLLERFQQVSLNTELSGTINDLKNGLHYYLRQRDVQDPDWIVRNFEQIEGDILLSRGQRRRVMEEGLEEPVYHFGFLSDNVMNRSMDELLPWPLTDYFIRKAYSPVALGFQVYYTALSEYKKFTRYALFYGLCFNECDFRLSYVVNVEENEQHPYFALELMGVEAKPNVSSFVSSTRSFPDSLDISSVRYTPDDVDAMDFFLCPYKYYLDMVCRGGIVIDNDFVLRRYYVNMLIASVWKEMQGSPRQRAGNRVSDLLKQTQQAYRTYFPFWRDANDLFDLQKEAENYIEHNLWEQRAFKRYDRRHMKRRCLFGAALFVSDINIRHPFAAFEQKAQIVGEDREYSLHRIPDRTDPSLLKDMKRYMTSPIEDHAVAGPWCVRCAHQTICMKPYQVDLTAPVGGGE